MAQPAVIFGGPSPEHDVSILTGLQAARALADAGTTVTGLYWSKTGDWWEADPRAEAADFADGVPRGARELRLVVGPGGGFTAAGRSGLLGKGDRPLEVGVAVNCCHGGPGEDGTLQAALDLAGVRYTGPSVAGAALGMDKYAFGAVASAAGLPSLPRVALGPGAGVGPEPPFAGPYIVKPRFGGSSIGIEVVDDWATARALAERSIHLRRGAVVEPYLAGSQDLNIAVRTFPELQLSAIERPLRSAGSQDILGYRDKYLGGEGMVSAARELPAVLPPGLESRLRSAAESVARIAVVRGLARIDFLVSGEDWYVNEINTIPGSLARYLWVGTAAVGFPALLADLLTEGEKGITARYDTTGADGTALRSAGAIASKLA